MEAQQGVVGLSKAAGRVLGSVLGRAGGTRHGMAVATDHSSLLRGAAGTCNAVHTALESPTLPSHASLTQPPHTCGQLRAVLQLASRRGSQLFCRLQRAGEEPRLLLSVQRGVRHAGSVHSAASLCGRICGGGVAR